VAGWVSVPLGLDDMRAAVAGTRAARGKVIALQGGGGRVASVRGATRVHRVSSVTNVPVPAYAYVPDAAATAGIHE
jgi:hypothetical protein